MNKSSGETRQISPTKVKIYEFLKYIGLSLESKWGTIAYRLECRTLNRENPVSNPTAVASKLWQVWSLHVATVHSDV